MVTTAVQGLSPFLNVKPFIVCVGDPAGSEALASLEGGLKLEVPHMEFLMPEGVNGRGV